MFQSVTEAFSDANVRTALKVAGWYEARRVDTGLWVTALRQEGLLPFPAALDALMEFGGLSIPLPQSPNAKFAFSLADFDPIKAGVGEADRVEWWSAQLGKAMYPLGELDGMMLLIAEDGTVYANCESPYRLILGHNIHEAIRLMIRRDHTVETILL